MPKLVFSLGGLTATLNRFPDLTAGDRVRVPWSELSEEAQDAIGSVSNYEDGFQWSVSAIADWETHIKLEAMVDLAFARKKAGQPYAYTLDDYIKPLAETPTRTNELAPGTTQQAIGSTVYYFARFTGWLKEYRATDLRPATDTKLRHLQVAFSFEGVANTIVTPGEEDPEFGILRLTIEDLTVTLSTFEDGGYQRTRAQGMTVDRSVFGSVVVAGPWYDAGHVWAIAARCNFAERELLEKIAIRSDVRRRNLDDLNVAVYDGMEPLISDSAPSAYHTFNGAIPLDSLQIDWEQATGSANPTARTYIARFQIFELAKSYAPIA